MDRRAFLKGVGAVAAARTLPGLAAEVVTTRPASERFTLGIFTGVYGRYDLEEAAERIAHDGFGCVMFDYHFKDVTFDPLTPDWPLLERIMKTLTGNRLKVACLYGYYNVIDANAERRKRGEQRLELLIKNWERFGTKIISLQTGTYHKDDEFMNDPQNYTEEGYRAFIEGLRPWVELAEKHKAVLAIEPYWRNIICSVERAARIFKDLPSPALKLTMDPCNYFRNEDVPNMAAILDEMFKAVGDQIVIAHAKDLKREQNGPALPGPGLGELDYPRYLKHLSALNRDLSLIIEHLGLEDVPQARDFVRGQLNKVG